MSKLLVLCMVLGLGFACTKKTETTEETPAAVESTTTETTTTEEAPAATEEAAATATTEEAAPAEPCPEGSEDCATK